MLGVTGSIHDQAGWKNSSPSEDLYKGPTLVDPLTKQRQTTERIHSQEFHTQPTKDGVD